MNSLILVTLLLTGCQNINNNDNAARYTLNLVDPVSEDQKITGPSAKEIAIFIEKSDTIWCAEEDIKRYLKEFPEMASEPHPLPPDVAYAILENKADFSEFGSEVGQDYFFLLYTYFLKKKNGIEKYEDQRQKLLSLFQLINSLNAHVNRGGSYFGHQGDRIHGYAEYAIYSSISNDYFYHKEYDISAQKSLFINSLRQFVLDEEKSNGGNNVYNKERMEILMGIVSEIDDLVSNYFILKKVQEFHYSYY